LLATRSPCRFAVVSILGTLALGALAGAIGLAAKSVPIPEVLVALGSAAVGALAGLITPSSGSK
jgi:hypothetical protein